MPASDDEPMAPVRTARGGESGAGAAATGPHVGAGAAAAAPAGAVVAAAGGALPAVGAAAFGAAAGAWQARTSRLSSASASQRRGVRRGRLITIHLFGRRWPKYTRPGGGATPNPLCRRGVHGTMAEQQGG